MDPPVVKHMDSSHVEDEDAFTREIESMILNHYPRTVDDYYKILSKLRFKLSIHPHCLDEFNNILKPVSIENDVLKSDLQYHDIQKVEKFADALQKFTIEDNSLMRFALIRKINFVFAVDGFKQNYKDYIHHLSAPFNHTSEIYSVVANIAVRNFEFTKKDKANLISFHLYVAAVRYLHDVYHPTPEQIKDALTGLMKNDDNEMTQCLKTFIEEENLKRVKEYISATYSIP